LELATTCEIARTTLENYLMILEDTYVIKLILPFHQNIRSELTKMPKLYFEDTGLRNILQRGNFATNLEGADLETAIYSLFRKNLEIETIHFWRTKSKQEIDFIIEPPEQLLAFEVKINLRKRDGFCLSRFKQYHSESQVFLVGLNWLETKKPNFPFLYPWQAIFSAGALCSTLKNPT
jgi:hypothetical protein